MKEKLSFLFLIAAVVTMAQDLDQEVIVSQGNFETGDSYNIQWTLGDISIESSNHENGIITQGFIQPKILVTRPLQSFTENSSLFQLHPNPAKSYVKIQNTNSEIEAVSVRVIDSRGAEVKLELHEQMLDLSNLKNGLYTVSIISSNGSSESHRIIKIN